MFSCISVFCLSLPHDQMNSSLKRGVFAFQLCCLFVLLLCFSNVEGKCQKGCDLAMASYYVWEGSNLTFIDNIFGPGIIQDILSFNRDIVPDQNSITTGMRIHIPFPCECLNGEFLAHTFNYVTQFGDTYKKIANQPFSNLTTEDWVQKVNTYDPNNIPDFVPINVTVNCSCGDKDVSEDYGLFATYPLRPGENLLSISAALGLPAELLQRFNQGLNISAGEGIAFLPAKDESGTYPPLSSNGLSHGAISGISVAAVFGVISILVCSYLVFYRRNMAKTSLAHISSVEQTQGHINGLGMKKASEDGPLVRGDSSKLSGITVEKSVEFSYEELAKATDNFSMDNKIGQGGFGSVYFGEVRGERAAIKKMDMQASKEFLAELKVLTHVHHLNLVRLIGYCVEGSLFVVYEYIENGNLSQHLRGSKKDTLSWNSRMQIALDSARGLEYIHEHTVPLYIHRDIKSANILIDKCFHAKVADFGLTKLTDVGTSLQTRLVGTFGYMPPEYAQYGEISPKVDVYAFGVVLYELISGKEAIVKINEQVTETKGLVAVFEEAFNQPSFSEALRKLVDTRLGDDYSLDSVSKMANLARACTHDNPQLRPSMRSIVVALMTLSSSSEDWDIGSFYEKQGLIHHLSGR